MQSDTIQNKSTLPFLQDGEMAEIIRNHDWSQSSIGNIDQWPQSLCATVGVMLHSAFPMFLFWGEDLTCFYNDVFRPSLGGVGKHPAIGKPGKDVWPEIWDFIGPLIEKVMSTGKAVWFEDQLVPFYRNGVLDNIYWTFSYSPAYGDDGKISGVFVTCMETTEKLKGQKQLEESEQLFRLLIEEAPIAAAFYTGKEITIRYANNIMIKYWGKDNSVIGKTLREALPELETQHFPYSLEKVFATGETYVGMREKADLIVDGRLQSFYFNFTYKPIRNKVGEVLGIHHIAIDVTHEVLAQKNLEESEQTLRNIILQAPVAMCILKGEEFIIDIANEKMIELWGKPATEVLHKPVLDALPEVREQGYENLLNSVYTTGDTFSANEHPVNLFRNGKLEEVFVNFTYQPVQKADASISHIIVVALDVTGQVIARRKIEQNEAELQHRVDERTRELANANNELLRSNSYLEEFAYAASHDLKEPIRKIHFFTNRLKNQLSDKLSEQDENMFERVEYATQRMNALIEDLLLYSHVSQKPVAKEPVDLNEKLSRILQDLELDIEAKGATINLEPLPVVNGYRRQLQQLFHNLLTNALKYSSAERKPEININADLVEGTQPGLIPEKKYHLITVADNGIGFEPEQSEKIFQMFHRLHGRSEYEGTGVGLSIARKVVENHNGRIIAEGAPGEGATFKIYLPVEES